MDKENNSDEKTIAHLGFIEATITRMGQNSFHAKTWCITIVAASLAFSFTRERYYDPALIAGISFVVVLIFSMLDAYYLYLEQGYRALYKKVAGNPGSIESYSMDIPAEYVKDLKNRLRPFKSPSIYLFYGALAVLHLPLLLLFYE